MPKDKANQSRARCLLIWQDNLFADTTAYQVDYFAPSKSITPFAGPPKRGLSMAAKLALFSSRLLTRQYQLVVIPGIDFDWSWDSAPLKARIRNMLRHILAWGRGSSGGSLLRRCLPKGGRLVVLDRYDSSQLLTSFLSATEPDLYFKANLEWKDHGTVLQDVTRLRSLPYELVASHYPPPQDEKDVDVLFALSMNSPARQRALEELPTLMNSGVNVLRPPGLLTPEAYLSALSRSLLCISPEGVGYHGFRHYEAMLCGSVPVINRALRPLATGLEDGKNCLMYDSECTGDMARVVSLALGDRARLQTWGKQLREHALARHSLGAVGKHILEEVQKLASTTSS